VQQVSVDIPSVHGVSDHTPSINEVSGHTPSVQNCPMSSIDIDPSSFDLDLSQIFNDCAVGEKSPHHQVPTNLIGDFNLTADQNVVPDTPPSKRGTTLP